MAPEYDLIVLGIAVATDYGLIVPVIHGADKKSLVELTLAASDLAQRARTKNSSPTRSPAAPSPSPIPGSMAVSSARRSSTSRR